MSDPFVGQLAFFRVYSGHVASGTGVLNATKDQKERIGRLLKMHANKREEIAEVWAGDIAAAVGLKSVTTGDTICDPAHPVILEAMSFPEPVISVSIEPKTKVDQEKLGLALGKLMQEDPTFKVHTEPDTGQTLISGMGELHLEIIVDRLVREFNVGANVGKPQVAYKETITARGRGRRAVHSPDRRPRPVRPRQDPHRARPPRPSSSSTTRSSAASSRGSSSSRSSRASARRWRTGRSPAIRSRASRSSSTTAAFHDVDSSEIAFKIAGSMAFQDASKKAKPVLLEPIMAVEVVTPDEYMGEIIGDLTSRRGRVQHMEPRGNVQVITCKVPLSEMFGYATDVRSMSQGRASYTMQFASYEQAPKSVSEEVVAKAAG